MTLLDLPQVAGEAGDSKQSDEVLVVNLASPESATSDDAEVNLVVEVENETPPKQKALARHNMKRRGTVAMQNSVRVS